MTTVVISQPMYFPWPGFLAQISLADVMIWLDDAQFSKGSFTNRVQVKTVAGRKWMTIPLKDKGAFCQIRDLTAARPDWQAAHLGLLRQSLAGRPLRQEALEMFARATDHAVLADALVDSAEIMARAMGVMPARTLISSQMNAPGQSWRRVLDMVLAVGGTRYVTGHGALNYLDHEAFEDAGIAVEYMDYNPRPWPQPFGKFTPYVTTLDLLAALPPDKAAACLNPAVVPWRQFKARHTARQ